jgi:hypothetical protein
VELPFIHHRFATGTRLSCLQKIACALYFIMPPIIPKLLAPPRRYRKMTEQLGHLGSTPPFGGRVTAFSARAQAR